MPIEGKANLNKDHSFTDFPITISNNVKSDVSNWSIEGNGIQNGTPTPDNPIQPTFCGVRTGNLFDISSVIYRTWTNDSGVIQSYGYGARSVDIPSSQITVSFNGLVFPYSYSIVWVDSNGGFITRNHIDSSTQIKGLQTFTPPSNAVKFYIQVANGTDSTSPITEEQIESYKLMLNLGSTALPYEPYGWAEKITCGGQTVPVYLGEVPTVRRVKKLVFDGTESSWGSGTSTVYLPTAGDANVMLQFSTVVSSHYTYHSGGTSSAPNNSVYTNAGAGTAIWFKTDYGNDVNSFKAFLAQEYAAGHPVTVWYVLANEQTGIVNEPLCKIGDYSDELLSTAQGTPQLTLSTEESNLISFETNLQPSKFNIKYYEEDYTKIKDIQMQIPTAKTYNYTEYPITISNAVSSNCSIDLFGNSIQNGTPSPDNPIIPEFVGVRTGNLFDKSAQAGQIYVTDSAQRYGVEIPVTSGTYTVSGGTSKTFTKTKIGDVYGTAIALNSSRVHTLESDGYILVYAANQGDYDAAKDGIMLNLGITTLPYEPYGWAEKIICTGQTTPIYLGEVPTVRKIKKLVLDGTDSYSWFKSVTHPYSWYFFPVTIGTIPNTPFYCTHGKTVASVADYEYGTVFCDNTVNFGIFPTTLMSVSGLHAYLADQYAAGTPVTVWYVLTDPTTGIVNEPLAKIGNYSDELLSTIQLEPFKQNIISIDTQLQPSKVSLTYKTKESTDLYKSIKYVLDNNNNYVYKSPYFYTWEGIREIVRAGKASQYYPIGSIIYDNFDESTGTAFQVVAYDNHFDPTLTAQGYTHSMTLCELLLTDVITFDAQEAFLYAEVDIPAGTYKFTIPNYDATYGGDKTYYFTSTATLPSGSQIVMNWHYQQTPKTVTGYAGPNPQTNTTALSGFSALTLTEWVDGTSPEATDLGTIAGPTTQLGTSNYGQMNHIHRARYGSNNYLQSGIRQYINSNSAANTWWTPQTVFDRPYGSRTSAGKLTKLNQDLVSVMATPEIKSRTNSYFETTSLDGTTFTLSTDYTINTDKMFLLSPMEVNFNTTDTTIGTTLDYYIGANNGKRIKIRKSNNTAYYWWLRTPYPSDANVVRNVNTSGALNDTANNSNGVAPACIIQ